MGFRLEFEAHGDKLISRELLNMSGRGADARPAFNVIAGQLMRSEKRRFSTQGNGTWPDLAASTKARKAASEDPRVRANANRVLVATGALRRSLTVKHDPHQELVVAPRFLVFGTTLEYAQYHQNGRGVKIRKPLGFPEATRRDVLRTLQRFIVTGDPGGSLAAGGRSREGR